MEQDPTPLHRAAKELIHMQLDTGEFPQQVSSCSFLLIVLYIEDTQTSFVSFNL
jgi:hypothetical protein